MTQSSRWRLNVALLTLLGPLAWCGSHASADDDPAALAFFEAKIRPVLVDRCYKCHSTKLASPKGKLRLDSREGLRQGGESGPVVLPGQADESPLIQAIARTGDVAEMPPK